MPLAGLPALPGLAESQCEELKHTAYVCMYQQFLKGQGLSSFYQLHITLVEFLFWGKAELLVEDTVANAWISWSRQFHLKVRCCNLSLKSLLVHSPSCSWVVLCQVGNGPQKCEEVNYIARVGLQTINPEATKS